MRNHPFENLPSERITLERSQILEQMLIVGRKIDIMEPRKQAASCSLTKGCAPMTREEALQLIDGMTDEELSIFYNALLRKLQNPASPGDHLLEEPSED